MTEETLTKSEEEVVAETAASEAPQPPAVQEDAPAVTAEAPQAETALPEKPQKPKKAKKRKARYYIPLTVGQKMTGTIKTVTDFGAFVNLGLSVDGLVHVSSMARRRVENISDVVSVGDEVTVWVKSIDTDRGRVGLTMIKPVERKFSEISDGDVLKGEVKRVEPYGVFVDIGLEREGLVHVSELSHEYVRTPADVVEVGSEVDVKVLNVDPKKKQVNLSIKALLPEPEKAVSEEVVEEEENIEEVVLNEEPMQTTMAAAFGITDVPVKTTRRKKSKKRKKKFRAMDDVVARTLANQSK